MISEAQTTKAKIDKWGSIKLKNFCALKNTINRVKRQPTQQEKVFGKYMIRDCYATPYVKNFYDSSTKKVKEPD